MSERSDNSGGRFEPEHRPQPGLGVPVTSACDECGRHGITAGRRRVKVARGPLRGLVGNVCRACVERRQGATA